MSLDLVVNESIRIPHAATPLMGKKRRDSSARLRIRATHPVQDRDTLHPCPACAAFGHLLYEYENGTYEQKRCKWCEGAKYVDDQMLGIHERWLRILRHHRSKGLCKIVHVTPLPMDR